ncbi:MAG: tripartite tricarboxylate transporter TctB family protein, partial [Pikeienuella sp.]
PAFWPGVAVIGMTVFGAFHVLLNWRGVKWSVEGKEALIWLCPLEYLAYFMVYVFATPTIGYLPASIIFAALLAYRVGYRSFKMIGFAAIAGAAIVLTFKTMLSVKIPAGALYDYLPDSIRLFAIVNF